MGMAASQARYLALSARKTNTEYEGQQLNQQRLNLSNQSADLFNQMLTMAVPTCPDSTNYTTIQYSWSDGVNTSVIKDYYRLGTPEEDYNYVVSSYHYENIYTGSSKKMVDPQVQALKTNHFTNRPSREYQVLNADYKQESTPGAADDTYTFTLLRNGVESTRTFHRAGLTSNVDEVEAIDSLYNRNQQVLAGNRAHYTRAGEQPYVWNDTNASWEPFDPAGGGTAPANATKNQWQIQQDITVSYPNPDYDSSKAEDPTTNPRFLTATIDAGSAFEEVDFDDDAKLKTIITQSYGAKFDPNETYYAFAVHADPADPTSEILTYAFITKSELENVQNAQGDIAHVELRTADTNVYYTDGTYYITAEELSQLVLDPAAPALQDKIFFHSTVNDPTFSNFTAVGNCELTEIMLDDWTDPHNKDMVTELKQVLKDMKTADPVGYANLAKCFDSETGDYLGGIYKFKMGDKVYYTTYSDLGEASLGAYKQHVAENGIDGQYKLKYYNAFYQKTKVEEIKHALLETDGTGRFSTVKFEDDSVVYTLTCEAITDEDAYNDAMNKYRYQQELYDNEVSRINAKTEIIQAEDRQLQLRLEQLGTEQTALQTEMEACQKVVSKNVESSFKTFGG